MEPFDRAAATLAACRAVLWRLTEDDLSRPSPCTQYTVGEVGQHVVRSMVLLASVAGEPAAGLAAGAAAGPVGPAAGPAAGPVGSLEEQVAVTTEAALAAWRRRGLDGTVAVGRSTLPATLAFEIIPMELLVHGWDVARATGQQIDVPPEVADRLLSCARELVTEDKRGRSFAAEVPAGPQASALQRLIAFTGRVP
jgi:uncharacterized protein (TIGR03086 family)